ncbi:MAG: hypothetical protein RIQ79_634 [Verrucomicrobiota bacterium]
MNRFGYEFIRQRGRRLTIFGFQYLRVDLQLISFQ